MQTVYFYNSDNNSKMFKYLTHIKTNVHQLQSPLVNDQHEMNISIKLYNIAQTSSNTLKFNQRHIQTEMYIMRYLNAN